MGNFPLGSESKTRVYRAPRKLPLLEAMQCCELHRTMERLCKMTTGNNTLPNGGRQKKENRGVDCDIVTDSK